MTTNVFGAGAPWDPRADRKANIVWMAVIWVAMLLGFGIDIGNYFSERHRRR